MSAQMPPEARFLSVVGGGPKPAPAKPTIELPTNPLELMKLGLAAAEGAEREALHRASMAELLLGDALLNDDKIGTEQFEKLYADLVRDAARYRAMQAALRDRIARAEATRPA